MRLKGNLLDLLHNLVVIISMILRFVLQNVKILYFSAVFVSRYHPCYIFERVLSFHPFIILGKESNDHSEEKSWNPNR